MISIQPLGFHVPSTSQLAEGWERGGRRFSNLRTYRIRLAVPRSHGRNGRRRVCETRLIDTLQQRLPERWHYPADREGTEIMRRNTRFDDTAAREEFGIQARPFTDTP